MNVCVHFRVRTEKETKMAKIHLYTSPIWTTYSAKVHALMNTPKHSGEISEEDAASLGCKRVIARVGSLKRGEEVQLCLAIEAKTGLIKEAKFNAFGSPVLIASNEMLCEMIIDKHVEDVVNITNLELESQMRDNISTEAVPRDNIYSLVLSVSALKQAASIYLNVDVSSFEEDVIVCECAHVSLETIENVIRINNIENVEQITQLTKAGAFCKSCVKPGGESERAYYLVDILERVKKEMEAEKAKKEEELSKMEGVPFIEMTLAQKLKAVDDVIEENIRQMLIMDGGDMEIIDIKESGENVDIYIRYLGACSTCSSGSTGTLFAIEAIMKQKLDKHIRVLPI